MIVIKLAQMDDVAADMEVIMTMRIIQTYIMIVIMKLRTSR